MNTSGSTKEITCATQGHLWGPHGKCVMCGTPRPVAEDNAALRVALRNAKHRSIELPERTVCMAVETYEALVAAEAELQRLRLALEPGAEERAFSWGWRIAANWAKRDDLAADIGSPAYLAEMRAALTKEPKHG